MEENNSSKFQPNDEVDGDEQQQQHHVEQTMHTVPSAASSESTDISHEKTLSKNQLKRLKRHEKWLDYKAEKRAKEKEKKKRKMAEARERGETLGPTRKTLKKNSMANSGCKIRVCVDCSFDEYMNEKDVMKLVKQIQHCYSVNRRAANPLQFYVSSTNEKTKERLDMIGDYKNWDIYFKEEHHMKVFDQSDMVYLTSESPNVLMELDPTKAYIIGGLVDHNHHKGLCHQLAVDNNIGHAQLPIGDYIDMKSRKVLTVDHVFEILLQFTETGDWKSAFFNVIPQRKTFVGKDLVNENNGEEEPVDSTVTDSVNKEIKQGESSTKGDNPAPEPSGVESEATE